MKTKQQILNMTSNEILKAYSGKSHTCACGCAGKYAYNPIHQELGGKDRGYAVSDDELNLKQINRILNYVKKNIDNPSLEIEDVYVSVENESGSRVYVLYYALYPVQAKMVENCVGA